MPFTDHAAPSRAAIAPGQAFGTWTVGWVAGTLVAAPLAVVVVGGGVGDDLSIPQLTAASVASWSVLVVALVVASRRVGTGSFRDDYAFSARPVDLLGIPVGIAAQLVLVPVLYWPLRAVWPDTFSADRVEERAQDLADRAGGWNSLLLAGVVVVGAPLVEELVYRGLLQRSMSTLLGRSVGLGVTALWFALIHFSPVEYPGLILVGLVFGAGVAWTGRLGPAIVTHAAFNATGLVIVLR